MLPAERQKYIKEMIQMKSHIKISELSEHLGVSDMTIHRDVKPLIEEGIIVKTFGGISSDVQHSSRNTDIKTCVCCNSSIKERMSFHLILTDQTLEKACCAHCGLLRYKQLKGELEQAICHDFLRETTIDAHIAWYVMETSIHVSCCRPQILTFALKENADQFVKGFGGDVYSLSEAIDCLHQLLADNRKCHQAKGAIYG